MVSLCAECHQTAGAPIHNVQRSVAETGEAQHDFIPGPSPDIRIVVTDREGTVLDSWERELPDLEMNLPGNTPPKLARLAITDLAQDIWGGIE